MADNTKIKGPADAARVNVGEDYEVAYWTKKFGVSAETLKSAVGKVGPMADKVARELGK